MITLDRRISPTPWPSVHSSCVRNVDSAVLVGQYNHYRLYNGKPKLYVRVIFSCFIMLHVKTKIG